MGGARRAVWRDPDGAPVSCAEKLKVLEQNLEDYRCHALDLLEDAALMGCDVEQFRQALRAILDDVEVRYSKK